MSKKLTTKNFINLFLNKSLDLENQLYKAAGNRLYKTPNELAFAIFEDNPDVSITDLAYALAQEQAEDGDYQTRPKFHIYVNAAARWMADVQGVDYKTTREKLMAKCREVLPIVTEAILQGSGPVFWFQNNI